MSSIMRARNGLTGRSEVSEVIGLSPELKVAGPSMLGIGCPDRHALPRVNLVKYAEHAASSPPARAVSFFRATWSFPRVPGKLPSPSDLPTFVIVRCQPWFVEFTTYALASCLRASSYVRSQWTKQQPLCPMMDDRRPESFWVLLHRAGDGLARQGCQPERMASCASDHL